jgi:tryptophan halogenase
MAAGWSWRIDHMRRINRGYVYCPAFISDAQAEEEFRQHNPKLGPTHTVRFVSGRYQRGWVKNVVAIGNAFAFVEPLEATSLGMICHAAQTLGTLLHDADCNIRETQRCLYNRILTRSFDNIRWFLSIHYKFNDRLETPFWRECREKVDIGEAEPIVEFFRENGPTTLLGQQVAYQNRCTPAETELKVWNHYRTSVQRLADRGLQVGEAMEHLKSPQWKWNRATFLQAPVVTGSRI